ncbi:hypothetical protein DL766_000584 [Monosporascus sp. MC13-8B]|uniref:Uncharacterized protein n=1 Tax=Monosporascus cannonballus TaxID=155416 RepID=A0ABY0GQI8_9PEZI|nr:hypothetical protein DL762_010370 [Monosporascus cannonballus]RYO86975.1 hypothetical protein DL763_006522 [Monosporascus cannonballus]RYP39128.1 hypothetical protein DL766_000584 [Monosporascus sp. MC13-8B]
MKYTALLVAGASCASARWLRWSSRGDPVWTPQETGLAVEDGQVGWTPQPTPAPGARKSDQDLVVEYLKRQDSSRTSRNTWTNEQTCASAFTCDEDFSCMTNDDNNVACGSGTYSPFFTVCLDHRAFRDGACDNANSLTGCCQDSEQPACGTYIWTGSPTRSMYRCFEQSTIISLLDIPQFVIDASRSSESERLKSLTASKGSSKSSVPATTTSDSPPASPSDKDDDAETTTGDVLDGDDGEDINNTTNEITNNTPAIVGGAVGGVVGLITTCLLLYCLCRRKRKDKSSNSTTKWSSRAERKHAYKTTFMNKNSKKQAYDGNPNGTYVSSSPTSSTGGQVAAPARWGFNPLSMLSKKDRGPTTRGAAPQYPGHDKGYNTTACEPQKHVPQQYDATTVAAGQQKLQRAEYSNPSRYPDVERQAPGGNGNITLNICHSGPPAANSEELQYSTSHTNPYTGSFSQITGLAGPKEKYNPRSAAAPYQQPQYTDSSSTTSTTEPEVRQPQRSAHPTHSVVSDATYTASPGTNLNQVFHPQITESGYQPSDLSGSSSSTKMQVAATGLGVGLGLNINKTSNNHHDEHHHHHHQHHHPSSPSDTATPRPQPQTQQQQLPQYASQQQQAPRYADSSTMTTESEVAAAGGFNSSSEVSEWENWEHQEGQYRGGSGRASSGADRPTGADYQQPRATGTTISTTTEAEDYGGRGGAWYRQPPGYQTGDPVELEASPAIRKVD